VKRKKMKRHINGMRTKLAVAVFILSMVLCTVTLPALAAPDPSASVSPAAQTVDPGDSFSIDIIVVPEGEGISSGQLDFAFDASVMQVDSVTAGDLFGASPNPVGPFIDNVAGTASLALARIGMTTPPTPNGTFASLTLTVDAGAAGGTYALDITNLALADENFAPIAGIVINDGAVNVTGVAPPTIVSYTISNSVIVPPQTTEIDVEFSEEVDYTIAIEKDSTVVYDWPGTATNPDAKVWDGTYEANGTQVPDGDYTVNVTGTSTATGLSVNNRTEVINVTTVLPPDTTAPTTAVTVPPDTTPIPSGTSLDWTNTDVMLSFHRVDNGGGNVTGVAYTNYSLNGVDWLNETGDTDFSINITAEGETTVWYYSVDNAGNPETTKNLTVRIDTIPPGTVTNLNDTDASWTWIQWNWTNPEDPSLDHVEVWLGAFNATTTGESYRAEGLVPDTTYTVNVRAVDVAGNKGAWQNDTADTLVDEEAPVVTVTAPNGGEVWNVGSAYEIIWTATDNAGVDTIDIAYSTDGGANYTNIAVGEANGGTYTWTVPNDQSTACKVKVVAYDVGGNTGEDVSDVDFTIADTEDPVLTVTAPTEGATFTTATITVSGTATDNVEVTSIEVNGVPVAITPGQNVPFSTSVTLATGANTITVVATDSNNNTGTRKVNVTYSPRRVGGGSRGPATDTDGDGYSDIVEWLQGSDPDDPCDPDPNSEACLAAATPTATPTATPKPTVAVPTPVTTPTTTPTTKPAATPTPTPEEPGFGAVFAIAGLLAVAYLVLRRKQE
jgi:PGF-CTERM protein